MNKIPRLVLKIQFGTQIVNKITFWYQMAWFKSRLLRHIDLRNFNVPGVFSCLKNSFGPYFDPYWISTRYHIEVVS